MEKCSFVRLLASSVFWFKEDMAKNGVELELKDAAAMGSEKLSSPKGQRTNYEALKELNDNNGKQLAGGRW